MKRGTLLLLGGLALVGGAVALVATQGSGPTLAHGLELGEECTSVHVVDPEAFVRAWIEHVDELVAGGMVEADLVQVDILEDSLSSFLRKTFPQCAWPPEEASFTWHAPMLMPGAGGQQFGTRSWDQLIEGTAAMLGGLGAAGTPGDVTGELLSHHPTLGPVPVPTPDDEDDRPRPPIPPIDGLGGAGGGDGIIPDNVVTARGKAHMDELGVALAMEPDGALAPVTSSVVVVYDPDWPLAGQVLEAFMAEAAEHPEVLVVLASTHDTHAALGLPEELGTVGLAINSADGAGEYANGHAYAFDDTAIDLPGLLSYFHHAADNAPQGFGVSWQK